ncbi:MAG: DNA alkylation repair protein [Rickettsiales bacterium]|jgi:3-methyladenine DNA glycosylase AlkD|nr:DNA alkylation repair protein [Rickettsiales bacterium]
MHILETIRGTFEKNRNLQVASTAQRFFKEKIKSYGLKAADTEKIAREYYETVKSLSKDEIFNLCENLWKSGYQEEVCVACEWSYLLRKKYDRNDIYVFEKWIDSYVKNWAMCDKFCNHTVGTFVEIFPQSVMELKKWSKSNNYWLQRASAVSLIIPAKKGLFKNDIFEIAENMFGSDNDMVQKGYGWLLKCCSQYYQQDVYNFVTMKKSVIPRTAYRYAIEKMPADMKKKAMSR